MKTIACPWLCHLTRLPVCLLVSLLVFIPICQADRPKNCVLHSRFGSRIDSCSDIKNGDVIFIVPQGRLFIWPTFYVGHIAKITHIRYNRIHLSQEMLSSLQLRSVISAYNYCLTWPVYYSTL